MSRRITCDELDVPNDQCDRDLLLDSCPAAMVSSLRGLTTRSSQKIISCHLLRALGVKEDRAREIVEQPLPDISK